MDTESLSHTQWNCKYHIVFAPKYRRQAIYGKIKADIGKILRKFEILFPRMYKSHATKR